MAVATSTVLDSIALAYQCVWGPARQIMALRLHVLTLQREAVSAEHLMRVLGNDWPVAVPALIIAPRSLVLLEQALQLPPLPNTMLEVPASLFASPEGASRLAKAAHQGHRLVRRISASEPAGQAAVPVDTTDLLCLGPQDIERAIQGVADATQQGLGDGPLTPGSICEGIPSRSLADQALDGAGVAGLAGWPVDDTLKSSGPGPRSCDRRAIRVIRELAARDVPLDRIERQVRQDPVMIHRLLVHVNKGGRREVDSLRHALMMLGFTALEQWLSDEEGRADSDADLHPVRQEMVMRARLAQHLLDPGSEDNLRAEVFLTAILAGLDRLLGRTLADLLDELPLSDRVRDALLRQSGPYWPLLELSTAQGKPGQLHLLSQVCEGHDTSLEMANRALLRMLATTRSESPDSL